MCDVFKVLSSFDFWRLEYMLFVFLEERWFYVYNRVIKGSMEFSEVLIIEDGSDDYLVYVL